MHTCWCLQLALFIGRYGTCAIGEIASGARLRVSVLVSVHREGSSLGRLTLFPVKQSFSCGADQKCCGAVMFVKDWEYAMTGMNG